MTQERLGRYRILEDIASGTQGSVHRAYDPEAGRLVALKILHASLTSDRSYLERFHREASMASSIDHPNAVRVFDVGEEGGRHYVALEFLPENLARLIQAGAFPVDRAAALAAGIADGLGAVHALGIVHRDVKPQNVLITPEGAPKVTDFGIARGEGLSTMTATGVMMGTPYYMSPEQARGERADAKSDVYALGCVLYEMLTGEVPFHAETPLAVLRQHIEERPRPLRRLREDVPREVAAVVERAMAKDPRRRYRDGAEMAAAIRRAVPSLAEAPLVPPQARREAPESGPPLAPPSQPRREPEEPSLAPEAPPVVPVAPGLEEPEPQAMPAPMPEAAAAKTSPLWRYLKGAALLTAGAFLVVLALSALGDDGEPVGLLFASVGIAGTAAGFRVLTRRPRRIAAVWGAVSLLTGLFLAIVGAGVSSEGGDPAVVMALFFTGGLLGLLGALLIVRRPIWLASLLEAAGAEAAGHPRRVAGRVALSAPAWLAFIYALVVSVLLLLSIDPPDAGEGRVGAAWLLALVSSLAFLLLALSVSTGKAFAPRLRRGWTRTAYAAVGFATLLIVAFLTPAGLAEAVVEVELDGPAAASGSERNGRLVFHATVVDVPFPDGFNEVDSMEVQTPDGRTVPLSRIEYDFVARWRGEIPGPPEPGEYLFVGRDKKGGEIGRVRRVTRLWDTEPLQPPEWVRVEPRQNGLLVAWDEAAPVKGVFDAAAGEGYYQLVVARKGHGDIYRARAQGSPWLVPRRGVPGFSAEGETGRALKKWPDGEYTVGVFAVAYGPEGGQWNPFRIRNRWVARDGDGNLRFLVENGAVVIRTRDSEGALPVSAVETPTPVPTPASPTPTPAPAPAVIPPPTVTPIPTLHAGMAVTPLSMPSPAPVSSRPVESVRLRWVTSKAPGIPPFWEAEERLVKDAGQRTRGRITVELEARQDLGLSLSDVAKGVREGKVEFATLSNVSVLRDELPLVEGVTLPGLYRDMDAARKAIREFKPELDRALQDEMNLKLLGLWPRSPVVTFCRFPVTSLDDLRGRRVRIPGGALADFVEGLGATPVTMSLSDAPGALERGEVACAMSTPVAGNIAGLREITVYLYKLPVMWSVGAHVANLEVWNRLGGAIQQRVLDQFIALEKQLSRLMPDAGLAAIACNSSKGPACKGMGMAPAEMELAARSEEDDARMRDILRNTVLLHWVQRCGIPCANAFNRTIGPVMEVEALPILKAGAGISAFLVGPASRTIDERIEHHDMQLHVLLDSASAETVGLKSAQVRLPNGSIVDLPCRPPWVAEVDCESEFVFGVTSSTLPAPGTYVFSGLDDDGSPIPGLEWKAVRKSAAPPDPPSNLSARATENGLLVTWDPVKPVPGSFDPVNGIGRYEVFVNETKENEGRPVYSGVSRLEPAHVIPSHRDGLDQNSKDSPPSEWADGTYELIVQAYAVDAAGPWGQSANKSFDPAEDLLVTVEGGVVVRIEKASSKRVSPGRLVHSWPLDGNVDDVVGDRHGALHGGASFASGVSGLAVSLDGVDDFVDFGNSDTLDFGADDFTVAMWVRFAGTTGEQVLMEKWVETKDVRIGWTLTKLPSNVVRLAIPEGAILEAAPDIPENVWIQVALARQGDTFTLYWNGAATASGRSDNALDSPASLKVGHRGNPAVTPGSEDDRGFFLHGAIDDVMVFDRALSAAEVQAAYKAAGIAPTP